MGRKCLVCSHPRRKEIDKNITNNVAYRRISAQFKINDKAIGAHAKNHLQPQIKKAVKEIDAAVKSDVIAVQKETSQYRDEILLAPIERARMMQEKLLNLFDSTGDIHQQISAAKEFRGWFTEEAKLCGLYQKERENTETLEKVVKSFNQWLEDNPAASNAEKAVWVQRFAKGGGVPVEHLAGRVGVTVQEIANIQ